MRHLLLIILTIAIGLAAHAVEAEADSAAISQKIVAHRGAHKDTGLTENSLEAVKYALEHGVANVEIDVRETKDHQLILYHNAAHDSLVIAENTYQDLVAIPLRHGERIPTLGSVLTLLAAHPSATIFLEIKAGNTDLIDSLINENKVKDQIIIISFDTTKCEEMIDRGYRVMPLTSTEDLAALAARGYYGIDFNKSYFAAHPEKLQEAHVLGLTVNIWTINDPSQQSALLPLPYDYLTTDLPLHP